MARPTDKERLKTWKSRINLAEKAWKSWNEEYKCEALWDHYCGHQWAEDQEGSPRYVINLFFPTIEIRKPSLLFYRPKVKVEPRPGHSDDPGSNAEERARLTSDTVSTFIGDSEVGFADNTYLALLEAFFRYGVIEVGYTADYIDNPHAGKPILWEDTDEPLLDENGGQILQPERVTSKENLFVKWIPADQFRVSANEKNHLRDIDWCGYYEWHYPADLRANPNYKNTSGIKTIGRINTEGLPATEFTTDEEKRQIGLTKVWKIWDVREKMKLVFCEDGEHFLLEDNYKKLPLAALKFHERLKKWYPIPPTYNWISPQHELNETREMQKVHRRRAIRRYTLVGDAITDDDMVKLETGEDCTWVKSNRDGALQPVPDAPLDAAIWRNIPTTKEDFREISGVTGEERGVASAETATQAQILDSRSQIRESFARFQVARWLAEVADLMIWTIIEYMPEALVIKANVDELAPSAPDETARVVGLWYEIRKEQLLRKYDVSVDVESLSPLTEDVKRTQWNQLMMILTNQNLLIPLSQSDLLLRKTLAFYGVKSDREIQEIKRAMQTALQMIQQMVSAKTGGAPGGSPLPAAPPGPGPTPAIGEIMGQLKQQLGPPNVFQ